MRSEAHRALEAMQILHQGSLSREDRALAGKLRRLGVSPVMPLSGPFFEQKTRASQPSRRRGSGPSEAKLVLLIEALRQAKRTVRNASRAQPRKLVAVQAVACLLLYATLYARANPDESPVTKLRFRADESRLLPWFAS